MLFSILSSIYSFQIISRVFIILELDYWPSKQRWHYLAHKKNTIKLQRMSLAMSKKIKFIKMWFMIDRSKLLTINIYFTKKNKIPRNNKFMKASHQFETFKNITQTKATLGQFFEWCLKDSKMDSMLWGGVSFSKTLAFLPLVFQKL